MSNNYYSMSSKTHFERPTIPPILKMAQQNQTQQQQHQQSQQTQQQQQLEQLQQRQQLNQQIFANSKTKLNSLLDLNDSEARCFRQKQLLQEQIKTSSEEKLGLASELTSKAKISSFSSLATAFPTFYLNPNETNYAKLINSILNSKLKPSICLPGLSDSNNSSSMSTNSHNINNSELNNYRSSSYNINSIIEDDESSNNFIESSFNLNGTQSTNNNNSSKKNKTDFRLTNSYINQRNGFLNKYIVSDY